MSTTSPNMSLPIPDVGVTGGPDYASDVNAALTLIDQHDHTPGNGVQITPAGININTALDFASNFATTVAGVTFTAQSSTPAINTVYQQDVDLYFVDGLGNDIQITQDGGIAGSPGSIANLLAPASASYVSGSSAFVFQSDTGIAANVDCGSILLRNLSPNSTYALTIDPPSGLASNYAIKLPALPASTTFVTIGSTGTLTAQALVDDSSIQFTSSVLSIKNLGVTTGKLATASVTEPKMATSAISILKSQTFTSNGTFTVPDRVNKVIVEGCGAGGSGGGGGGAVAGANSGGGGGGGSGAPWRTVKVDVTPGASISVVISGAGTAGAAGSNLGTSGTNGGNGSSSTFGSITFYGGGGGTGGGGSASGGAGGVAITTYTQSPYGGSGGAGTTGSGAVGADGMLSSGYSGGSGGLGAGVGGGGGGAGGGGAYGAGGSGGKGANNTAGTLAVAGDNAGSNTGGGGGGGGAGRNNQAGAAGGEGATGRIVVYWSDLP